MTAPNDVPRAVSYAQYLAEVPFLDHLNILVEPDAAAPILVVDLDRIHMNGGWNAHGGLIMTMLDMAMAAVARLSDPDKRSGVTVEMKTNFLRPGGKNGGRLSAQGKIRHTTKSLAFCDGELHDAQGNLIATASGTFKFFNRPLGDAP